MGRIWPRSLKPVESTCRRPRLINGNAPRETRVEWIVKRKLLMTLPTGTGLKNTIVIGMPRSGTSMTAAIFARQGYFLAEDTDEELRPGDENNPEGYFEAAGLVERNVHLFRRVGYTAHNSWLFQAITDQQADQLHTLERTQTDRQFVSTYEQHSPWLWKDPRLCYTLGYWWPLLNPETTRVLVLRRRPEETWKSFVRLDWREFNEEARVDVYQRINHHLTAAMKTIERLSIPHIVVHYDEYSESPMAAVTRINTCMGLHLDVDALGFDGNLNSTTLPRRFTTFVQKQRTRLGALLPRSARVVKPAGRSSAA